MLYIRPYGPNGVKQGLCAYGEWARVWSGDGCNTIGYGMYGGGNLYFWCVCMWIEYSPESIILNPSRSIPLSCRGVPSSVPRVTYPGTSHIHHEIIAININIFTYRYNYIRYLYAYTYKSIDIRPYVDHIRYPSAYLYSPVLSIYAFTYLHIDIILYADTRAYAYHHINSLHSDNKYGRYIHCSMPALQMCAMLAHGLPHRARKDICQYVNMC